MKRSEIYIFVLLIIAINTDKCTFIILVLKFIEER